MQASRSRTQWARRRAELPNADSTATNKPDGVTEATLAGVAGAGPSIANGTGGQGPHGIALSARPNPARTSRMLAQAREFSMPPVRVLLALAVIASVLALLLGP